MKTLNDLFDIDLSEFKTFESLVEAIDIEGVGLTVWELRMKDSQEKMKALGITPSVLLLYYRTYRTVRELKRVVKDFEVLIGLWEYKLNVGTWREDFQHISPDLLGVEDFERLINLLDKERIGLKEWERRMDELKRRVEILFVSLNSFLKVKYPKYRVIRELVKTQFHFEVIRLLWTWKLMFNKQNIKL